jgi:hypothetical protein
MARFAKGKYALAISDISGQAFPWNEMVTQWNGLFVHYSEFESKQPQLDPKPSQADPTALPKSRPQQPPPDTLRFLDFNPLRTFAAGSPIINVNSPNHQRNYGDQVRFRGAPTTSSAASTDPQFSNIANIDGITGATICQAAGYTVYPASGNKYYIDNVQQDTLTFIKTGTYTFSQTDSTNETHPLRFYTAADKSGGEYTTGVTTFGTPGVTEGAYTRIVVDSSAPATLYYQCSSHAEMGGQINITEVTDNQLTGVTRGAFGSTAASHNSGVSVRLLLTPANNYYFTAGSNATTGQIAGGGYNVSSGPVTLKTIGPQA